MGGPCRIGNRMCEGMPIYGKGQPAQYGWRGDGGWEMDWSVYVHTHRITPGYLKGNFTA